MTDKNPWKTLNSKTVYKNAWIHVREDQVLCPDGSPGIYGVVESRLACGAIALTDADEIVLVGQYRYPTEHYSWEIIEGGAEKGESGLDAAKRELREEAGLIASSWERFGPQFHLSNCHSSEIAELYIARGLTAVEAAPDHTEILQVARVPIAKVLERIESGEITDAMTIIAVQRLALMHRDQ